MHYIVGEMIPAHHVLRVDLRPRVVGMVSVGFRPLPQPRLPLRTFPRGCARAGGHPRQDRDGRVAGPDGALAVVVVFSGPDLRISLPQAQKAGGEGG
jgi:hypothetical protein